VKNVESQTFDLNIFGMMGAVEQHDDGADVQMRGDGNQ